MADRASFPVMDRLATYAVAERCSRLPEDVIHQSKRAVVDWCAAAYAGIALPQTVASERALADELDCGGARLLTGRRATIRATAFISGVASHAAEVDDVYRDAVFHPGSPTISAALAIARAYGCSGDSFLRAVVVGYEISTRIARTVFAGHYRYWHPTGTIGCMGAAAAAATLLNLDREQFVHALSTATSLASGLQQAFRSASMTKPLHAAHAAEIGAMSALTALHGMTGGAGMLDGAAGFGAAMASNPDWEEATRGLGADYNIKRVTFKNHCCCGQAFVPIDGALFLRSAHVFTPELIDNIRITTYRAAADVAGGFDISTPERSRFSIPYTVAHALVHGSVRLDAFDEPARTESVVRGLMSKTQICIDDRYTALFPEARYALIEIGLANGRVLRREQTTCKGTPEDPLSDSELSDKFMELTAPSLGQSAGRDLLADLWKLDSLAEFPEAPSRSTLALASVRS